MREFAYRNDGIPWDVIRSPFPVSLFLSAVLQNAHNAVSRRSTREARRGERKGREGGADERMEEFSLDNS